MSQGKRNHAVTTRLRAQLAEAESARRRLEHRVVEAERERDAALEWKRKADEEGHPAIVAAELRATQAEVRGHEDVLAERRRWEELVGRTRLSISKLVAAIGSDQPVWEEGAVDALVELYGSAVLAKDAPRQSRRTADGGGGTARKAIAQFNEDLTAASRGLAAVEAARRRRLGSDLPGARVAACETMDS